MEFNLIELIAQAFFGNGGLTKKQHRGEVNHRFSNFLPYIAADFATKNTIAQGITDFTRTYYLNDNSFAWIYEYNPLVHASNSTMRSLSSAMKLLPNNSILQMSMYADPYVDPILYQYSNLRANSDDVFKMQAQKTADFVHHGTRGVDRFGGTPTRNYRGFITIKIPLKNKVINSSYDAIIKEIKSYADVRNNFESTISATGLQPKLIEPNNLLSTLHRLFNNVSESYETNGDHVSTTQKNVHWNSLKPLNKQIINAETEIKVHTHSLQIGSKHLACMTPKELPQELDIMFNNNFLGFLGVSAKSNQDDIYQIHCPFIYNINVVIRSLETKIRIKAGFSFAQKASEQSASGIFARQSEYRWALNEMEQGEKFFDVIPTLWLIDDSDEELNKRINELRAMWSLRQLENQLERDFMLPKLFVSSLPAGFSFYDLDMLERNFILQTEAIPYIAPVSAGWKGSGEPYLLFYDRKGQVISFDFFNAASNKNFLVTGTSGGGKSFGMNYLLTSYIACGFKVRVIDIGDSYKKITSTFDGTYISTAEKDICINFFSVVDNISEDLNLLTSIIVGMAYSSSNEKPPAHDIALIETAIRTCFAKKQQETTIDDIVDFLANMETHLIEFQENAKNMAHREQQEQQEQLEELNKLEDEYQKKLLEEQIKFKANLIAELKSIKIEESVKLGFKLSLMLTKFSTQGEYGKYFNGETNVDVTNPVVVIELDKLQDDLRNVIILAFASIIANEIYNGDRKTPTIILLDEAHQTLTNPAAAYFVDGLYRKARKYNAGVGIVTQSVADYLGENAKLAHLANVLKTQAATHFMLADSQVPDFREKLGMSEFECEVLFKPMPDTKSIGYRYSEMVIRINGRAMVVRLTVDTYTYFLNSSDPVDNGFIMDLREKLIREENLDKRTALTKALVITTELADAHGGGSGGLHNYLKSQGK